MKRSSSSAAGRVTLGALFIAIGIMLLVFTFSAGRARSATPANGSIGPAGSPVSWDGTATGTGAANGESSCVEGTNCDTFTLTVTGSQANWTSAGKRIEVTINVNNAGNDYDLVIHKDSNAGTIVDSSANAAGTNEVGHISPSESGVGTYTVHVIYFATIPGIQYHGVAAVVPLTPAPPPPAGVDNGPKIGYENFNPPGVLTPVTTTTGPTVEYMGRSAGEPSIGVNWNSAVPNNIAGVTNFQSDLETLFVTFNNVCPNAGPTATWSNLAAPTSQVIDSDPIGFTDQATGRVFAAELSATSPSCKISYSDNDGMTWIPTPGPLGSGIDHQTIGGGPYHTPLTGTVYPDATYYCSQDLVAAFCLRSDDGGATWGPPIQTYTTECGGLHGHVKVAPDGTVYLPNKDCGGESSVVVSENNGLTWSVRKVRNATTDTATSASDPAVGIDASGTVYYATADNDSSLVVATSTDRGSTWSNIKDVSGALGLKNIRYPAAVGGSAGRAAVAFFGTTSVGNADDGAFNGVWHLYVAHTFDGGLTWTTSDATPNDPVQRGCIWTGGGANICRNLLDFFDVTIDKEGRVQVGYDDGCLGSCAQSTPSAIGNSYSATAAIARQSSGRRLLAAFDPPNPLTATSIPGMPLITTRRVGPVVHLTWSEADTGNSTITSYQILRGISSGGESLLTTVPGTQTNFDDSGATDTTKTYYYKVVAVNGVGPSCANNEVFAPYVGDTCTGLVIHQNDPSHPESPAAAANPQLAIDYISVSEPSAGNFLFKMKVTNLSTIPPNSRWRIVWDTFASPGQQFYVGMRSSTDNQVTFDYGTIATAVVGLVVGVPQETSIGPAAGNFQADGTITILVPKSGVGDPQPGDLLGAVNGRTFAGDTPATQNLERSTNLIDHTFVKAQTDNAFPAATYTVVGNASCAASIVPVSAVSRKTHPGAGTFDVNLPLAGNPGIECRTGGASGNHQVVITFAGPVTLTSASVTSGSGSVSSATVSNNQIFVNLTNIANAQTISITLVGVDDGTHNGNVAIPMSVLLGDTGANGAVNSTDVSQTKAQSGNAVTTSNFREDVTVNGSINSSDVSSVKLQSGTALAPGAQAGPGNCKTNVPPSPYPPMRRTRRPRTRTRRARTPRKSSSPFPTKRR